MFDTVFIIDDTSSMQGRADSADESDWPLDKWTVLERCMENIVGIATEYDKDGVDVYFLKATDMSQKQVKDPETILNKLKSIRPLLETEEHRGTFFHDELRRVIDPVVSEYTKWENDRLIGKHRKVPKPLNLIVITDGEADDDDDVEAFLTDVAKDLDRLRARPRHVGVQFVQIGDDKKAAQWLTDLDDGFKARDTRDVSLWHRICTIIFCFAKSLMSSLDDRHNSFQRRVQQQLDIGQIQASLAGHTPWRS